jgi:type III secretory pathway component EscV
MNKDLKNRVFKIPQDILIKINQTINGLNGQNIKGIQRSKKLLEDKTVKYNQLKKIIYDIRNMDKIKDKLRFNLCGGELMEKWALTFLNNERDLIKSNKKSKKESDETSGLTGQRKNSYLSSHTKRFNFKIPLNLMKSNSNKTSISSLKLFEELEKIKKLITY